MRPILTLLSVFTLACESPYKNDETSGDSGVGPASEDDTSPPTDGGGEGSGGTSGGSADGDPTGGGSSDGGSSEGGGSEDGGSDDTATPGEPEYDVRSELPEAYLSLLTETLACNDTWMGVYSADHTIGLRVYMPSVLSDAEGEAHNVVNNLPHPSTEVTLEWGGNIPRNWCTDELSDDRVVNGSWIANYGAVTMYIDALTSPESTATGRFTLAGLDFTFEGGWVDSYESPVMNILTAWGG